MRLNLASCALAKTFPNYRFQAELVVVVVVTVIAVAAAVVVAVHRGRLPRSAAAFD